MNVRVVLSDAPPMLFAADIEPPTVDAKGHLVAEPLTADVTFDAVSIDRSTDGSCVWVDPQVFEVWQHRRA
jgi:hypothetical protein